MADGFNLKHKRTVKQEEEDDVMREFNSTYLMKSMEVLKETIHSLGALDHIDKEVVHEAIRHASQQLAILDDRREKACDRIRNRALEKHRDEFRREAEESLGVTEFASSNCEATIDGWGGKRWVHVHGTFESADGRRFADERVHQE